jgi:HlyD family secretion protein
VLLAVVVVLALIITALARRASNALNTVAYNTYTVAQGSITYTITGSGKLESADTENIDVPDGIKVADVAVQGGDSVKAGDTLATLDIDSVNAQAAYLSGQLSSLDAELSRMSRAKTTEYVYASVKGRIKYLPVSEGDDVLGSIAQFGSLALISTDGLMQVEIETPQTLAVSAEVTVKWQDGSADGQVAQKTASGYLITLDDDEAPYQQAAQVYDGETLLGEGLLDIHAPAAVYADGGTISDIHYSLDESISPTSKLFTLENEPFSSAYQQKYSERTDVANQLKDVLTYKNDAHIVALSDGVISKVNVSEGAETGAQAASAAAAQTSSGESTAFVVNTGGARKMVVSVDELDIYSVKLDQQAMVTLDAISSEKFAAKVTRISSLGNAEGSITTFAVELTLSPDERFLDGMNGNATIMVKQADNVLIIPVEAINEDADGAFVYTGETPDKTYIKTGLSDGEYAEVTSGLASGAVIKYTSFDSATLAGFRNSFRQSVAGGGESIDDE